LALTFKQMMLRNCILTENSATDWPLFSPNMM